ncbi:MAG: hypothetical protein VB096_11170 [Pseudoflavonifractor sp.]|nr:hypothetical protein [Pseudoflavonifractor sp.]
MKKYLILLAAILAVVGLEGCSSPEKAESPEVEVSVPATVLPTAFHTVSPAPTRVPESPAAAETGTPPAENSDALESAEPAVEPPVEPITTPSAVPTADGPSDEEILRVYRKATEAYSWFAGYGDSGLALDSEDTQVRAYLTYFRVTAPELNSVNDLRAYLKTMFSDEVVDGLLAPEQDHFLDIEGGLYALPAGRGADPAKGGITTAVLWPEGESPKSCTVQTTVELLDPNNGYVVTGEQVYNFPYAQVGDKWVFTQFEAIF